MNTREIRKKKRTLATKTQGRGEQKRKETESKELTHGGYVAKWNDFQLKDLTNGLKHESKRNVTARLLSSVSFGE